MLTQTQSNYRYTLIAGSIALILNAQEVESAVAKTFQINSAPAVIAGNASADPKQENVVMHPDGSYFVVTWLDEQGRVLFRKLDQNGNPMSNEVVVGFVNGPLNEIRLRSLPSIAMNAAGTLVIVWGDANDQINGRIFDSSGNPLGETFNVTKEGNEPVVTWEPGGNILIGWNGSSRNLPTYEGYLARFAQTGTMMSDPLKILELGGTAKLISSIDASENGYFIANISGLNLSDSGYVQVFDQDLKPVGNSIPTRGSAAVAMDSTGDFIVVNSEETMVSYDRYLQKLNAKVYDVTGRQKLSKVVDTRDVMSTSVAMDASGNFIVGWTSYQYSGYDSGVIKTKLKGYSSNGKLAKTKPRPGQLKVNGANISLSNNGRFVRVWQDNARILGQAFSVRRFRK